MTQRAHFIFAVDSQKKKKINKVVHLRSCSDVWPPLLRVVHTGDLELRIEGGVIALYWLRKGSGLNHLSFLHKNSLKAEEWAQLCLVRLKAHTHTHRDAFTHLAVPTFEQSFLSSCLGMFPSEMLSLRSDRTNCLPASFCLCLFQTHHFYNSSFFFFYPPLPLSSSPLFSRPPR